MQNAEQLLQAMSKMGEKRIPLTRVYRSLFSQDLFLAAYDKIARNHGALTPGTERETVDGMSLNRIQRIIEQQRNERFRFRPARRILIPKKSGGTRPLGIPNFSEKLVQEVVRQILEAYYEPRFRDSSHGFRPERGCHTALTSLQRNFKGATWFIEGDIRGCFDNIDHGILLEILARDIQDGRLLNLIRMMLEAGYLEGWQYHHSYSGTPQGGILSPLLANVYLNELDGFIEDVLIPQYTRGEKRGENPEYRNFGYRIAKARKAGKVEEVKQLENQRRQFPSQDVQDPDYRRLHYIRYADDFILSFVRAKVRSRGNQNGDCHVSARKATSRNEPDQNPDHPCAHATSAFLGICDQCLSLKRQAVPQSRNFNENPQCQCLYPAWNPVWKDRRVDKTLSAQWQASP